MAKTYYPLPVAPSDPAAFANGLPAPSALRSSTIPAPPIGADPVTENPLMFGGDLGRGVGSGFHGAIANIQAYGAAMADSMGFKDFADGARQSALRRAEFAQSMAPTVGTTDQIHGFHDALKYGAGAFGGALGSLAPTAVAGALGGTPGAFMSLVPMSGGEVAMRQYAAKAAGVPEAQNVDPRDTFLAATGQGLLQGGLNLAPIMSIVGKGPLARMATRSGVAANPIERFATRAGTTALAEGAQEGGEELTNQLFMQALHGKPLGQDLDTAAIRENAIAGAVGMAPFGAVHGVSGALQDAGGAGKVLGLRAAAEARRKAAEGAEAVRGSDTMANIKEVGAAYKDSLDAQQGLGEDANLGSKVAQHMQAARDTGPIAAAALKSAAGAVTDSLSKVPGKAADLLSPERRFKRSLDFLERGEISDDEADNTLQGRSKMVADALSRLDRARESLTPEEAQQLDQWIEADPGTNARMNHAPIAQMLRKVHERNQNRELAALFKTPLRGAKTSLSPTTAAQAQATKHPQWSWLERAVANVFGEPSEPRGSEAPGAIGDAPLTGAQAKSIQRQATQANTGPVYTPSTPTPKGQKPQGRMVPESESSLRIAHYFTDASDVDADQAIRGFRNYVRRLATGNDDARAVVKQVRTGLAQRFADNPDAVAHLTGIVDAAVSVDDAIQSGDEKAAKKALNSLLKSVKFVSQPAVKALARLGNMKPEEAQQVINAFRAAQDSLESRDDQKKHLDEQEVDAAIDRQFGKRAAEARQILYSQLPRNHPLMDPHLKGMGDAMPPTVEGMQRAQGDEFDERNVEPGTLNEVDEEDEGPRILSELGAFSRHAIPGSRDKATGRRMSEMEASGRKMVGGEYATGPEARFRAMDVREATERLVGRSRDQSMKAPDPFAPEALAGVQSYAETLDKFISDTLNRHQQIADEARERLSGAGVDVDGLMAEAKAQQLKPQDLLKFFEARLETEDQVDDAAHIFWTDVRQQHYAKHGAEQHAKVFPYSVHAIRGRNEIHAIHTDQRLGKAVVAGEADPAEGRVSLNDPTGTPFTLDVRKALEHALGDKEENFTLDKMREAYGALLDHLQNESTMVDAANPFPEATAKVLGLGGDIDSALAKAIGVVEDRKQFTPEQATALLKAGPVDKALRGKGVVGGFTLDGKTFSLDFQKAVTEAAKAHGMDEATIRKMDVENVAALVKEVFDALRAADVQLPGKTSDMKDVVFYTTDKGKPIHGSQLTEFKDVLGAGEQLATLETDSRALSYRKTLKFFNSMVDQFDTSIKKSVEAHDREIASAKRRMSEAQRAGRDTSAMKETIDRLTKERTAVLKQEYDKKAVELYKKASADEFSEGNMSAEPNKEALFGTPDWKNKRAVDLEPTGEDKAATHDISETRGMRRENTRALIDGLYETLNRLGNNLDERPESEAQDFSAIVNQEGVATTDPTGAPIRYARPGDLKAPKVKASAEAQYLSQVEDMLRTDTTAEVLDAIKGYPPEAIQYIRENLKKTPKTSTFLRGLEKLTNEKKSVSATDSTGMDDFGNHPKLDEFKAATAASLKKFGAEAPELGVAEMRGQSGSYIPAATPEGKARAWISSFAKNPFQAGAHEDLHHFFALMRKAGGEALRVIETLDRATQDEKLLAKARELLTQDASPEQAKALLEAFDGDPEERMAYLYQLRVAGLMNAFNPAAEGAIRKIWKWIQSKIGVLTDNEKAENILKALDEGRLTADFDNPTALARVMGQEKRIALAYRSVEKSIKPLVEAVGNVFTPSYDRLLKMSNSGIKKIADAYGSMDTNDEGRMGIVNERDRKVRLMENEFSKALGESTKAERDSAIQEILNGNPQSELAQKISDVMKQYTEDRVPNVLDRERIEENIDEFLKDVNITGLSDPGNIRRALWGDASQEMFGGTPLPSFEFKNPAKRAKWQRQTAEEYLGGFIKQFAAREAREAAFGKNAEKLKAWLEEARVEGMTDADLGLVKQFVAGAEGWLGKDMHPQLRKLQGAAMTGLNLFHLPYSVLSAMVDPIYIGVRSASMQEAWNAYKLGIQSMFDTFSQKEGRLSGDAAKFAEDVGLIAQAGIAEPMGDFFSAMSLEGASKKINAQFFRWNLLQGWERAMFASSAMAAQRFLIRHAENANEHSAEYLKELGLKPEDITVRPDGHLAVFENDGLTKEQAARIQNAIYKFSHQSAARPTAMTNPIWMNDPHFALIAHMKRFIMAQSAGVLAWMDKQRETKNFYPLAIAALAVPIQLASGQVRNLFTGGRSMPDDFMSAFIQGASEAGLMGRWHFGYDVANSAYHNLGAGIGVDAIAGPAIQDFLGAMRALRSGGGK